MTAGESWKRNVRDGFLSMAPPLVPCVALVMIDVGVVAKLVDCGLPIADEAVEAEPCRSKGVI